MTTGDRQHIGWPEALVLVVLVTAATILVGLAVWRVTG